MSMQVSSDARFAYHRLRREAQTLGSISRSFHALAASVTAAYHTALTQPAPEAWATLVARTAALTEITRALPPVLVLDARERDALEFFEAIVRENADLLASPQAPWPRMHEARRSHDCKRRTIERLRPTRPRSCVVRHRAN